MMLDVINQPEQFNQWFGEFISQSRHELDVAPPEPPYQPDEIYDALQQGDALTRLGGLRVLTLATRCTSTVNASSARTRRYRLRWPTNTY